MVESKKNKALKRFILIGPGLYTNVSITTTYTMASVTANFKVLEDWILPKPIKHPLTTQTTMGKYHDCISKKWWERNCGDHKGGSFNEALYKKYLEVIYG